MKKLSTEQWINLAKEVHGEKYDYTQTMYSTAKQKLKIICPIHGEQEMLPHHHIKGYGCGKCGKEQINISNGKQLTQEQFLNRISVLKGLSFNKTIYKNRRQNVIVTCNIHGDYTTKAEVLLKGCGCPKCKSSKGEDAIEVWLMLNDIKYEQQKKFEGCEYIKSLQFDFYLPEFNLCIEYDGKQHFQPIKFFGGIKAFKELIIKDEIKNRFCQENNISLLRISYRDNIIETLEKSINKEKYAISRSKTN